LWRLWTVAAVLVLAGGGLVARAVHLQVFNTDFLNKQAAAAPAVAILSAPAASSRTATASRWLSARPWTASG
jgi:hypothetical protein